MSGYPGHVGIFLIIFFKIFPKQCGWYQLVTPCAALSPPATLAHANCQGTLCGPYGTITSRTPSVDRPNRSYGANSGMVPRFCQDMGFRDQKVLRRLEQSYGAHEGA